jgi:Flp pilus assembly protein TadD
MAEKALGLRPNMPEAVRSWGYSLRAQGDLAGAAAKFQQAVDAGDIWASHALDAILSQLDQAVDVLPVSARMLAAFRSLWRRLFSRRGIAGRE